MKTFVLSHKETTLCQFKQLLENDAAFELFASVYEKFPECLPESTRLALEAILEWGGEDRMAQTAKKTEEVENG